MKIDFQDILIEIEFHSADLADLEYALSFEFQGLNSAEIPGSQLKFRCEIYHHKAPLFSRFKFPTWFFGKKYNISGFNDRWITYPKICSIFFQTSSSMPSSQIYIEDLDLSAEVIIRHIHSVLGEFLEKENFIRLHALAFQANDTLVICPWASGTGKSSVAHAIVSQRMSSLITDEILLSKNHIFTGMQLPIALKIAQLPQEILKQSEKKTFVRHSSQKTLIKWETQGQQTLSNSKIILILANRRKKKQSSIEPASIFQLIIFFGSCLLGLGLPQMFEFYVRPNTIMHLAKQSWKRSSLCIYLIKQRSFAVTLSSSSELTLQSIEKLVSAER